MDRRKSPDEKPGLFHVEEMCIPGRKGKKGGRL